jgi:large subunit ribosomal protein L10
MAKTREQKEKEVKKLTTNFEKAKAVVFTTFNGLTVADGRDLRNNLRKEEVVYQVSKKTLLKKALQDSKLKGVDIEQLKSNVGVAFGLEDEVAPAKILVEFAQEHQQLQIQNGLLNGQIIAAAKVLELAKLPSKLELITKVVGTIKAPIIGIVNVLAGNLRGLVNVLNALKEKKI